VDDDNSERQEGKGSVNYDAIRNQVNTREASTLTFSTVAASASLVILSFAVSGIQCLPILNRFLLVGVVFALLGIIYREVTVFGEDFRDFKTLMPVDPPHRPRRSQVVRAFSIRLFLVIPLLAWGSFLCGIGCVYPFLFIIILGFIVLLQYGEHEKRCRLCLEWDQKYGKSDTTKRK
jgi:hypothetical protein